MEGFDPKAPSKGLGDVIAKFTHATGLDVVADKVAKALGEEDCGCNRRREKLNELIPFNKINSANEYRNSLNKTSPSVALPATVLVKRNLSLQVNGDLVKYAEGEKVYITEDHPIAQSVDYFLKVEAIEVVDKI
jgi:hypothetical protein